MFQLFQKRNALTDKHKREREREREGTERPLPDPHECAVPDSLTLQHSHTSVQ
jgi:hypothetical protein